MVSWNISKDGMDRNNVCDANTVASCSLIYWDFISGVLYFIHLGNVGPFMHYSGCTGHVLAFNFICDK